MNEHVRLGRISGIDVGANWSVLAIFGLLTYLLAADILPTTVKGQATTDYWATALVVAAFFFGALLAHELAHALVAEHYGVQVVGITLWMLGGVTRLRGEPRNPRQHLAVAVIGPLVSLTAAALFAGTAYLLDSASAPRLIVAGVAWLAGTNLLLGVFNLLPGAPLDGGRVVQSVLWMRRGDREAAAVSAAHAGRGLGMTFVGIGLFAALFTPGAFDGLWLALLGWFVLSASTAEERAAMARKALAGVRVSDVMTRDPIPLPGNLRVDEVLSRLGHERQQIFPVVDVAGRLLGLVTVSSLLGVPPGLRSERRVADMCVAASEQATPQEPVATVLDRLATAPALPVIDEGHLVGLLTPQDVERALQRARLTFDGQLPTSARTIRWPAQR